MKAGAVLNKMGFTEEGMSEQSKHVKEVQSYPCGYLGEELSNRRSCPCGWYRVNRGEEETEDWTGDQILAFMLSKKGRH